MPVLVDSSVWIDFFKGGGNSTKLRFFIEENVVAINELILAELVPFMKIKNQRKLVSLLGSVAKLELNVNWEQIIDYQYRCLKNGINGIGIPDLVIAQNAIENNCEIYSLDQHFDLMKNVLKLKLVK